MKCPYRKVIYHHKAYAGHCASDEEGFAECYGKECPKYDNGYCKQALREEKKNEQRFNQPFRTEKGFKE